MKGGGRAVMGMLLRISRAIDGLNRLVGRSAAWLILAAILVSAGNAVSRKAFSASSNAWLEAQWYLFGAAYLLAAAYTLQRDEHIRIDIINARLPARVRSWIDLAGHLFMLLPFTLLMLFELAPFVLSSMRLGARSSNAGGLILWPVKLAILAGFFLLFVQAVSEIIKRIAIMRGIIADPRQSPPTPSPPVSA